MKYFMIALTVLMTVNVIIAFIDRNSHSVLGWGSALSLQVTNLIIILKD